MNACRHFAREAGLGLERGSQASNDGVGVGSLREEGRIDACLGLGAVEGNEEGVPASARHAAEFAGLHVLTRYIIAVETKDCDDGGENLHRGGSELSACMRLISKGLPRPTLVQFKICRLL